MSLLVTSILVENGAVPGETSSFHSSEYTKQCAGFHLFVGLLTTQVNFHPEELSKY